MKLALIITTFERTDALACVLRSVERQRDLPDEIALADDGSGTATRDVLLEFTSRFARPVAHCWQPHEGFRVCRARNLALSRVTSDYVVIVDGDMVLHTEFIADHRRFARFNSWVQGTRILLDERSTNELIRSGPRDLPATTPALGGLRRVYAVHAPAWSDPLGTVANAFVATKSCNLAAWRGDLERVNGFNEDMIGWGPEDKELATRFENNGVRRRTLLFGGIAYHLAHPPASRAHRATNESILADTVRLGRLRCEHGLDGHSRRA